MIHNGAIAATTVVANAPIRAPLTSNSCGAVSYTHLDVYKRQVYKHAISTVVPSRPITIQQDADSEA